MNQKGHKPKRAQPKKSTNQKRHEPKRAQTKKGPNQKQHEPNRARTKKGTNQKEHKPKRAQIKNSTNQKGSKMAILAIVSKCALSVFFSLKEVMVWDAMRYPTMKFLAVNIVRPCEPHPRFFFRRFHLVFGLFQPKKVSSFFDITFNSGFDYPV